MILRAFLYPIIMIILILFLVEGEKRCVIKCTHYWITLLLYLAIILYLAIFSREKELNTGIVLIPLKTYWDMVFGKGGFLDCTIQLIEHQKNAAIHMHMAWTGFSYMLLNIELFMPFGFLITKCCYQFKFVLVYSLLLSMVIEVSQLLFKLGWFDVDDIANNVIGAIIGYRLVIWSRKLILSSKGKVK